MAHCAYVDSSAAIKLMFAEPETNVVALMMLNIDGVLSSRLTEIEIGRAARRHKDRRALQQPADLLDALVFVNITPAIARRAASLPDAELRSLDAIHLATALSLNIADLDFITYDARLARAARAHGLTVP